MKISVCIIATNRYKELVPELIDGIKDFFLLKHDIIVHIFTDKLITQSLASGRISIEQHIIPSYAYPYATLFRYKILMDVPQQKYGDYIFYIDADSRIVSEIGDEILAPVVAVRHPGYFNGGGTWGDNKLSLSYTYPEKRKKYYCGGFSGGSNDHYYAISRLLKERIGADEKNGVMAVWHDETHFNQYLSETGGFLELDCSYMMPEPEHKRIAWGINNFEPKILALEKPKNFRN